MFDKLGQPMAAIQINDMGRHGKAIIKQKKPL